MPWTARRFWTIANITATFAHSALDRRKNTSEPSYERQSIRKLALPYDLDMPTFQRESLDGAAITLAVGFKFWSPILKAGFRRLPFAATVRVPKTTMNEKNYVPPRENDVRRARQVFSMKSESVAEAMQN